MFNNIKIHFCLSANKNTSYKICIERSIIIILHYCINGSLLFLVKHNLFIKNVLIRHRISIVTFNLDIYMTGKLKNRVKKIGKKIKEKEQKRERRFRMEF